MFRQFFSKEKTVIHDREAILIKTNFPYSLKDTLECGQAFRYEKLFEDGDYVEYMTVIYDKIITVGQKTPGELIFYGLDDDTFEGVVRRYFALDTDYGAIKREIEGAVDNETVRLAAGAGEGIVILKQDPWEALFSFIISQNNNIPRIRRIIAAVCREYGVNLCLHNNITKCPKGLIDLPPCDENCASCGLCYSFPTAEDVIKNPEGLLPSHPGFRYRYLCDAASKVLSGEVDLLAIEAAKSYEHTIAELQKITGVGLKVAACCALFGFGNLEAFPIDVWMKRAIDTYFDGHLDPHELGKYAGVAQQYIFHYIRRENGAAT